MSKTNGHRKTLKLYRPQRVNANKHKPIGLSALRNSIGAYGIGDGITVAADGESLSGSARLETLAEIMPGVKIVEVETDGNTLIVNKRRDIPNAKSKRGQALSAASNLVNVMDYNPDGEILAALAAEDKLIAGMIKAERDSLRAMQSLADKKEVDQIIPEQWMILIDCATESKQTKLLARFQKENLKCRALVS
jgi:hypothetical protein